MLLIYIFIFLFYIRFFFVLKYIIILSVMAESENQEKDIRTQMLEALAKYNIKQVDVAREAGINHSTLSLWLQGSVKGNYINI